MFRDSPKLADVSPFSPQEPEIESQEDALDFDSEILESFHNLEDKSEHPSVVPTALIHVPAGMETVGDSKKSESVVFL